MLQCLLFCLIIHFFYTQLALMLYIMLCLSQFFMFTFWTIYYLQTPYCAVPHKWYICLYMTLAEIFHSTCNNFSHTWRLIVSLFTSRNTFMTLLECVNLTLTLIYYVLFSKYSKYITLVNPSQDSEFST